MILILFCFDFKPSDTPAKKITFSNQEQRTVPRKSIVLNRLSENVILEPNVLPSDNENKSRKSNDFLSGIYERGEDEKETKNTPRQSHVNEPRKSKNNFLRQLKSSVDGAQEKEFQPYQRRESKSISYNNVERRISNNPNKLRLTNGGRRLTPDFKRRTAFMENNIRYKKYLGDIENDMEKAVNEMPFSKYE